MVAIYLRIDLSGGAAVKASLGLGANVFTWKGKAAVIMVGFNVIIYREMLEYDGIEAPVRELYNNVWYIVGVFNILIRCPLPF